MTTSTTPSLRDYAALGRACEAHGLGWFNEAGEMRFQPPADMIAEAAEANARRLSEALTEIRDLEPKPFEGGLDWAEIGSCKECQDYKDHPLMRGICNTHRRPLFDRETHDSREEKRLGWRAKSMARAALEQTKGESA